MRLPVRADARIVAAAVVVCGALAGGAVVVSNVLADGRATVPTYYVSTSGSDTGPCSKTQPCQTFDAAYHRSVPGAMVLVAGGTYGSETITPSTRKDLSCDGYTLGASLDECITFQPDAGGRVAIGDLQVFGGGVRLRAFSVGGATVGNCNSPTQTADVVLQGLTGANLVINNATHVGDLNGNWGPLHGNQIVYVNDCAYTGTLREPDHVRLDGSLYHDAIQDADGQHLECVHVEPADYLTVRNSTFHNCAQHDLSLGGSASGEPETHYLIENNVLAAACSEQGPPCSSNDPIDMGCLYGPHSDWTIRFNSMDGGTFFGNTGCAWTGTNLYYGNVETFVMKTDFFCKLWPEYGWTRSYTVGGEGGIACGTGSKVGSVLIAPQAPLYDFRLRSRNAAVGIVAKTVPAPRTDARGNLRPVRSNTDAGAYQWDPVLIVFGRSVGNVAIGKPAAGALAFYGSPRGRRTVRSGPKRLQRFSFHLHSGELWLLVDAGNVVGVGTSSPYYTSVGGFGVGADVSSFKAHGADWADCARAFHRRQGGADVYVSPRGGKDGMTVQSIAMIRPGYAYARCAPSS